MEAREQELDFRPGVAIEPQRPHGRGHLRLYACHLASSSSVPVLFAFNGGVFSPEVRDRLAALIPRATSLIVGAERAEGVRTPEGRYIFERVFNSLFVLGEGAALKSIYDKNHLVPFGEYIPLQSVINMTWLKAFSHRLDGFNAGESKQR